MVPHSHFISLSTVYNTYQRKTTLFGTVEPVVAVIASSLWLHVAFKPFQIVGIILIMILILLLSLKRQPETLDE